MVKEYQLLTISAWWSFRFLYSSIFIPPSTSSPITQFMNNSKPPVLSADELAIIKAAAWARYHHGSASEGRPKREFDLSRSRRPPKPSRYKLEAMREASWPVATSGSHAFESSGLTHSPCDPNMPLLDSYEIMRISSDLGCVLDSTSNISYGNYVTKRHDHLADTASPSENGTIVKKVAWKLNGFWHRHAMGICGSREKMVDTAALRQRRHGSGPRPANCRPWTKLRKGLGFGWLMSMNGIEICGSWLYVTINSLSMLLLSLM